MNRWCAAGGLLILALGLALRLPQLGQRPFHADEAVHAVKFLGLWEKGEYRYDPHEYHGPVLYYTTLPFAWLSGARGGAELKEATLRLVPVCFGAGLIVLLWPLRRALGLGATLWAAAFTAISPAMVFYSRYYIHELLLVFFTLLAFVGAWRYAQTRKAGWALLTGLGLGLMHATKETFVFVLAAAAAGVLLTWAWFRWHDHTRVAVRSRVPWPHLLLAASVALAVSVTLFSSFFTNAAGPGDSWRTYLPWFERARGLSPHAHPWPFYLERLGFFHRADGPVWSEALVLLLALVGLIAALTRRGLGDTNVAVARFLGCYAVVLMGIYTLISYKTPWCLLGFYHGLIVLAGIGAMAALRWCRPWWARALVGTALALASLQLTAQTCRTAFTYSADRRNPYVYAHTSPWLLELIQKVHGVAKVHPDGYGMVVKVAAPGGDYWPLPWYLRAFKQIGYWPELPPDPFAPVLIAASSFAANLDEKSDKKWIAAGFYELRPRVFLDLYVQFDLWKKYVETRPRPPED